MTAARMLSYDYGPRACSCRKLTSLVNMQSICFLDPPQPSTFVTHLPEFPPVVPVRCKAEMCS